MIPAVPQVHMPVSSLTSSAFPTLFPMGRLYRIPPLRDCTADQIARSLPFLIPTVSPHFNPGYIP